MYIENTSINKNTQIYNKTERMWKWSQFTHDGGYSERKCQRL